MDFADEEVVVWSKEPTADEATIVGPIKQPIHVPIEVYYGTALRPIHVLGGTRELL